MNWTDTVNENIERWPTLFLRDTWEKSEFEVAHHYFIVLGNGLEWANTKDSSKGGYLISPRNHRYQGEWKRNIDPPYRHNSKTYLNWWIFDPALKKYHVSEIDHDESEERYFREKRSRSRNHVKKLFTEPEMYLSFDQNKILVVEYSTKYVKQLHKDYIWMAERIDATDDINRSSRSEDGPYPNFQKKYSCFWEIDPQLIKPDWKEAGLAHLEFWKSWFDNEKNHIKYSYCPDNPRNKNGDTLADSIKKWHPEYFDLSPDKFIKKIQTEYDCPIFTGDNWDELTHYNWLKHLKEIKTFLTETIDRLS